MTKGRLKRNCERPQSSDGDAPGAGRHRVVIVGAGFGGLFAAKALRRADVEVTVIDRTKLGLQGRNWRDRFNYQ